MGKHRSRTEVHYTDLPPEPYCESKRVSFLWTRKYENVTCPDCQRMLGIKVAENADIPDKEDTRRRASG